MANTAASEQTMDRVLDRVVVTIAERGLATPQTPVLLMVSGGSDSTALAYLGRELADAGAVGPLAMLHVNHQLRGKDSDADAEFVQELASALDIPLFVCQIDVPRLVAESGENMEAVARRERYVAANEALASLCQHVGAPVEAGRVFTAHTQDDRVESFYMRSIVGTGPGGFRSMLYANGRIVRPCLDVSRQDLRDYLVARAELGLACVRDGQGDLWREDATNAHTDQFRAFVRHKIVPVAQERNPQLLDTLCRTMNLIADEDDLLDQMASMIAREGVRQIDQADPAGGFLLLPDFGPNPLPLKRRVVVSLLQKMLGADARVEAASVQAVLAQFDAAGAPVSGAVDNIQGNLAVSANKQGVCIEPMQAFRSRRKKDK
ncbi:MAG: tRNA lysidine(34) synthetase TilS [Coriobacteriia bacterium]|nr:tRNA lysidine(34) synthetase TilS [Coriobacteriia bacterium]